MKTFILSFILLPLSFFLMAAQPTKRAIIKPRAATPPQAVVTWTYTGDPKGQATDFPVQRKQGPSTSTDPWVEIAAVKPGILSYTDTTIQADIEYCYRVGARNSKGTNWTTVTATSCGTSVYLTVPAAPANLTLEMSEGAKGVAPVAVDWISPKPPAKTHWVGLYESTAPDNKNYQDVPDKGVNYWQYTEGRPNGTFKVVPPKPGAYNFRT